MGRIRSHLSYANVMATVAVFVAVGGGAYAASRAPNNSVDSAAIINRQVKKPDLARNSVKSGRVGDGSLTSTAGGDDSLQGADILESSLGTVPSAADATHATNS